MGCVHPANLPPKAIELNDEGARALTSGDLTTALARVELAIEYNNKFTEAWVNKGLVELKLGRYDQARSDLNRAKKLNPDLPTPHHALGLLFETQGKFEEAEKHYKEALKVDPGFAPARVNLGRLLFQDHKFTEAKEQFFKLTEIAPESLEGWLGLCETLLQLEDNDEAGEQIALARKRFGDLGPLMVIEARLFMNENKFAEAEKLIEPATQDADPLHAANAWAWLAVIRIGKGDIAAATVAVNEATRIDPTNNVGRYANMQVVKLSKGE